MSGIEDGALQLGAHDEIAAESRLRMTETVDQAADVFARLAVELHGAGGVEETIDAVVQFALQALSCSYAGVALYRRGRRPEIAAVTDPVVADIYNLQIDDGSGPLIESLQNQTVVLVRDTAVDLRWPAWAAEVARLGVRSVLDVPLAVGASGSRSFGVLGLYSPEPDAFGADDEAVAHILARHASVAVATARHEQTLAQAVDARKLVGQAMGILMERYGLDGDRAFAHAMLEDYRAGLGVDRHTDESDRAAGRRIECPTLVLWSTDDDLEQLYGDPVEVWRPWCRQVEGHGIKSGHHLADGCPQLDGALDLEVEVVDLNVQMGLHLLTVRELRPHWRNVVGLELETQSWSVVLGMT